jgi:hypothetical protein
MTKVIFENMEGKPKHVVDIAAGPIAAILERYGAPPRVALCAANAIIEHLIELSLGAGATTVQ